MAYSVFLGFIAAACVSIITLLRNNHLILIVVYFDSDSRFRSSARMQWGPESLKLNAFSLVLICPEC